MSDPQKATALHPFCKVCGWRKGGSDSWDGKACKCGLYEKPITVIPNQAEIIPMKQSANPTARPWKLTTDRDPSEITDSRGRIVAQPFYACNVPYHEAKANAALIVQAVNERDGLIAILREIVNTGRAKARQVNGPALDYIIPKELADRASAALKSAEGRE